ncbi:MAG: ATP-binding cassette domain-containing protein, partial [Calditrichaeota bacterium]
NINSLKPSELRSKIGYLFQSPYLFEKTVRDNFLYVDTGLDDAKIPELLNAVNLTSDFIDKNVDKLSIGEKQRVALARLLVTNPDIILLDEPTSALDPSITETIEQLILSIVKQQNLTAILVTHNPQQALRIGQNALLLVNGKLVETGTVDEVLNNPKTDFGKKYKAKELR